MSRPLQVVTTHIIGYCRSHQVSWYMLALPYIIHKKTGGARTYLDHKKKLKRGHTKSQFFKSSFYILQLVVLWISWV
jgi:hypothetical protein